MSLHIRNKEHTGKKRTLKVFKMGAKLQLEGKVEKHNGARTREANKRN